MSHVNKCDTEIQVMDKGWAWVILASHFIAYAAMGTLFASGLFTAVFMDIYGLDKSTTAWIGSVHTGLVSLMGPVSGGLTERYGPRKVMIAAGFISASGYFMTFFSNSFIYTFVTYGVVAGTGIGLIVVPVSVTVGFFFNKYRAIAFGILTTSTGFSYLVLLPTVEYLISNYSWKHAMLFLSGVCLQIIVAGALTRDIHSTCVPETVENDRNVDDENQYFTDIVSELDVDINYENVQDTSESHVGNDIFQPSMLESHDKVTSQSTTSITPVKIKQKLNLNDVKVNTKITIFRKLFNNFFCLFAIAYGIFYLAQSTMYIHFPFFIKLMGASSKDVSIIMFSMGASLILARFTGGLIASKRSVNLLIFFIVSSVFSALTILLVPSVGKSLWGQRCISCLLTFFPGTTVPITAPIIFDYMGSSRTSLAFGALMFLCGCAFVVSPPIAGFLFDVTGSYTATFYTAGCITLVSSLLLLLIPLCLSKRTASLQHAR